jgi:hypothetical protein
VWQASSNTKAAADRLGRRGIGVCAAVVMVCVCSFFMSLDVRVVICVTHW